jgi:hypothetical protein
VEAFRALKKWHGDQHLDIKWGSQPKKWIQGNGGSQQKLAAAHRQMIRHAGVAQHKGHGHTGLTVEQRQQKKWTRENVARGTLKRWTFGKRQQRKQEGINEIRNQGSRQEPHLSSRTALGRIFRKTAELEITKQTVGTSIRLQKIRDWTVWRGWVPPKQKKRWHTE